MGEVIDRDDARHQLGPLGQLPAWPTLATRTFDDHDPGRLQHPVPHCDAYAGEDLVEGVGELGVPVANEEPERAGPPPEIHEQIASLRGRPRAGGVGGYAQDVNAPRRHLHDEQHVQALQEDRVDVEEVAGQQPFGLQA
ncbi:hypothetical protein [Microtetraspora malaysiensis]|uniref:hypothetical protein n=1 Tax=Microtetraspora malaysiensis TaxID=161358 RepID=UPI003D92CDEB